MAKRPAFLFYPGDWRRDVALQSCTFSAQGLWLHMLCLAHESPRVGFLEVGGRAMTVEQLARLTGGAPDAVAALLAELEAAGVFSRDEGGVIYSRRMVRDEEKRLADVANGQKGGNPALKKEGVKGGVGEGLAPGIKPSSVNCQLSLSMSSVDDDDPPTPQDKTRPPTPSEFLEVWNKAPGLRRKVRLTEKELPAFCERTADPAWCGDWREALQRAAASKFCKGGGANGWRGTVRWFLQEDVVPRLLEGEYDDWHKDSGTGERIAHTQAEMARRREETKALQAARRNGG